MSDVKYTGSGLFSGSDWPDQPTCLDKLEAADTVLSGILDKLALSAEQINAMNQRAREARGGVYAPAAAPTAPITGGHYEEIERTIGRGKKRRKVINKHWVDGSQYGETLTKNLTRSGTRSGMTFEQRFAEVLDPTKSKEMRQYLWDKLRHELGLTGIMDRHIPMTFIGRTKVNKAIAQANQATERAAANADWLKQNSERTAFTKDVAGDIRREQRMIDSKTGKPIALGENPEALKKGITKNQQMEQVGKVRTQQQAPAKPAPEPVKYDLVKGSDGTTHAVKKTVSAAQKGTQSGSKVLAEETGGKFMNFLKRHKKGAGIAAVGTALLAGGAYLANKNSEAKKQADFERRKRNALMGSAIGGLAGAGLGYAVGDGTGAALGALAGAGLGGYGGYKYASCSDLQAAGEALASLDDKLSVRLLDWHSIKAGGRKVASAFGNEEDYKEFEESDYIPNERKYFTEHGDKSSGLIFRDWELPAVNGSSRIIVPLTTGALGGLGGYVLANRLVPDDWKAQLIATAAGAGIGGIAGYNMFGGRRR